MLLAILDNDDEGNCSLVVNKILGIRRVTDTCYISSEEFQHSSSNKDIPSTGSTSTIRKFVLPKLNIHTNPCFLLYNLDLEDMQKPPALKDHEN